MLQLLLLPLLMIPLEASEHLSDFGFALLCVDFKLESILALHISCTELKTLCHYWNAEEFCTLHSEANIRTDIEEGVFGLTFVDTEESKGVA